jgi:hypothetical protein
MDRENLFTWIETAIFKSEPLGRIAWKKIDFLVKLHNPVEKMNTEWCFECVVPYPCPTIRLIESDLE